jgi:cytochrome b pre-mRNA-processing protein 6
MSSHWILSKTIEVLTIVCEQYPITGSLMKPASNPNHYTDLVKELEQAPERSLLGRMINKWKGFLRFQ